MGQFEKSSTPRLNLFVEMNTKIKMPTPYGNGSLILGKKMPLNQRGRSGASSLNYLGLRHLLREEKQEMTLTSSTCSDGTL
jgi:hypothetical protein